MNKIHVMSESLANKIAAGEVVERISSVVKELVENSIDANSKIIIVDLIDSGMKSIKVTDDGIGMSHDDALLSFERHATSKIKKDDDLFFIETLGFRGEALASIASVSKVDLYTSEGDVGTHIKIEGGKLIKDEDADARKGSIIEVKDLFYNTPARLKYLKSDASELASVTNYIEYLSLSHPEISFTLTNNSKRIVYTTGENDLLKTIHEIYGYSVSSNMISIEGYNDDYEINGYICKPVILRSTRNYMITIVNGRVISNNEVNRTINDAYFRFKPDNKYPICVIRIETDPTLIDVNIHPSKHDIKFSKIDSLKELLTKTISSALRKTLLVQDVVNRINIDSAYLNSQNDISIDNNVNNNIDNNSNEIQVKEVQEEFNFGNTKEFSDIKESVRESSNTVKRPNEDIRNLNLTPIAIIHKTYIVAEDESGMYLIDQHAAHERINYERIMKDFKEHKIYKTKLLVPITIELSPSDFIKIKNHLEDLNSFGFTVEEFGINTIIVKEHPTWLRVGYESEIIYKIISIFLSEKDFDYVKFNNRVIATIACKSSVRANEEISLKEAKEIIDQLILCDNPYNCAHGRPTIIKYSNYDLARMFKRIMN